MKIAQYGTTIVVMHAIVHGLHGFAHKEIPVPLPLLQTLFCWFGWPSGDGSRYAATPNRASSK
jgi:hypothetical protein